MLPLLETMLHDPRQFFKTKFDPQQGNRKPSIGKKFRWFLPIADRFNKVLLETKRTNTLATSRSESMGEIGELLKQLVGRTQGMFALAPPDPFRPSSVPGRYVRGWIQARGNRSRFPG